MAGDFNDYSMDNRTYRYFKGQPLYGFGYGLSYSTFKYDLPKITGGRAAKKISVSVRVTNTGKMVGDEVVQLYFSANDNTMKLPERALRDFKRISLKSGESNVVTFNLVPADLSIADNTGKLKMPKGKIIINVGGCQPGEKTAMDKKP